MCFPWFIGLSGDCCYFREGYIKLPSREEDELREGDRARGVRDTVAANLKDHSFPIIMVHMHTYDLVSCLVNNQQFNSISMFKCNYEAGEMKSLNAV